MTQDAGEALIAEASEFIMAYYSNLVYTPKDIPKFYDPDTATIWRDSLGSKIAIKFADAQEILVPEIEKGSQVSVIDFSIAPVDTGYSLTIIGKIDGDKPTGFVQAFTIAHKHERILIASDSLRMGIAVTSNGPEETVFVPPRKKPAKRDRKAKQHTQEPPAETEAKKEKPPAKRNGQKGKGTGKFTYVADANKTSV